MGFDTNQWSLAKDLEDMDKAGTAIAFLSLTTPGFTMGEINEVRKVSRGCNEAAAKLIADHPGRFGSFATIPLTDTEGALREAEYALDTLKADGISLFSNYGDVWLGHATFAPVYEELNRRKTIDLRSPGSSELLREPERGEGWRAQRNRHDRIWNGHDTRHRQP